MSAGFERVDQDCLQGVKDWLRVSAGVQGCQGCLQGLAGLVKIVCMVGWKDLSRVSAGVKSWYAGIVTFLHSVP